MHRNCSDKLKVVFDLNPALVNKYSGFYAVGAGLLDGFEQLDEKPDFTLFYSRRYSNEANSIKKHLGSWVELKSTFAKMRWLEDIWKVSRFPKLEYYTKDFDIYHCLHHMMPPTKGNIRILTVHDLRRYVLSDLYTKSKLEPFELAVKRADHFIAVSESTKNDLCNVFGVPREKVDVVHLAASSIFNPVEGSEKSLIKQSLSDQFNQSLDHYFVVFSSPDKRKNIGKIINAFIKAEDHLPSDLKLVVVGNPPKHDVEFESIDLNAISNKVLITGPIDDIKNIFRCADGLVFASLYEGFGIPILEAFGCGVPVITSDCSSMPEVAEEAALLVDPYDVNAISEAIIKLAGDNALRDDLIAKGRARSKEFSWKKSAEKTFEIYKKLCDYPL